MMRSTPSRWAALAALAVLAVAASSCADERPPRLRSARGETELGVKPPRSGPGPNWPRWGGPNGDFRAPAGELADSWPVEGPALIWSRSLGPGFSSIVFDRGMLFTVYRRNGDDAVVAMRAADGATVWEYRYPARTHPKNMLDFGSGPHATPLIIGDRVVTLGFGGTLSALERETGRLLWFHDLIEDFGGQVLDFGNSASPVDHDGTVLVLAGGERQAVLALNPADGSVVWRSEPGTVSYATPVVIDVEGQRQLVYMSEDEVVGLDPTTGERLWSHPSVNQYRDNVSTPLWYPGERLLWTATQEEGAQVLRLERNGGRTVPREIWSSNRFGVHYWNALRLEDHVYASIGGQALVIACIDIGSGEVAWRRRGFEKVNMIQAGDKTILLDANGELALVRLSPAGLELLSQVNIADGPTWTVPTLVGTTLYVRDKKTIRAYDLGGGEGEPPTESAEPL